MPGAAVNIIVMSIFADHFRPQPWWWEDAPLHEPEDAWTDHADVVVVGSGYAGLSCAIELARSGVEVLVLDALAIGGGASSRAAGFTSGRAGVSKQINLEAMVGPARAAAILDEADAAHDHLQAFIASEEIDCDFTCNGRFVGAHTPRAYDAIAFKMEEYNRGGRTDFEMVPPSVQGKYVNSDFYRGGMMIHNAGSINPAKYHAGLVRVARKAGVRLIGHTRVAAVSPLSGGKFILRTSRGDITAREVMIGTNGYTDKAAPFHRRRIIPMSSTIIATEKLGRDAVAEILPAGVPVIDTKRVISFIRTTPDGERILFGGRARFTPVSPRRSVEILHQTMRSIFPQLTAAKITHSWSGLMGFSFDFLPKLGAHQGVHYALACNGGSGIVMMSWLGRKAAQNILGQTNSPSNFEGLPYRSHPLYAGLPWFVPIVGSWYRFRDWMDLRQA